ncbi:MAG: SOS response-associated peptidase [Pseudomonadota bacterium]
MCGRFWASLTWEEYRALLDLQSPPPPSNFQPNWNTAPTHNVLICNTRNGERRIEEMKWGLVPPWMKEKPKFSTINAKSETLEEKASWKGSLHKQRCVIAISGFYEWRRGPGKAKQAFAIKRKDGKPMLLAGLWAFNEKVDPDQPRSFTIITCPANETMGAVHDRMPVILDPGDLDLWLGPAPWGDALRGLLKPCPDDWLTASPVSNDVGAVKNNAETLIDPLGPAIF